MAKLIPDRGAWMEFETRKSDYLTFKFNRKRTVPVTILLRALAAVSDGCRTDVADQDRAAMKNCWRSSQDVDNNPDHCSSLPLCKQEPNWEPSDRRRRSPRRR